MLGPLEDLLAKHESRYCLRKQVCLYIPKPETDNIKRSIQHMSTVLWKRLANEERMTSLVAKFKPVRKFPQNFTLFNLLVDITLNFLS